MNYEMYLYIYLLLLKVESCLFQCWKNIVVYYEFLTRVKIRPGVTFNKQRISCLDF